MPLVSSAIPNLIGGVSQQPAALRLPTSSERLENAWPSIVSGNQKRRPSEHVATIPLTLSNGVAGYIIDRDPTYEYAVLITNGDLKVVDLNTGALQTVTFPNGKDYLNESSPVDSFRFVTLGDFTFIVNRDVIVSDTTYAEPASRLNPVNRGYVYVTQSQFNTNYSVYINGVRKALYTSPNGASGSAACPDTAQIAEILMSDLVTAGYTCVRTGSTIVITNLTATDSIQTQGASGDKSVRGFRDSVQTFSDLPVNAPVGSIVKVAGDVEEAGDDYYVIFDGSVWVETYAYGSQKALNWSTMPHVLVRNVDGTWTFKTHSWANRNAGNDVSNQVPSFVGVSINDIFVYQNRMGFLADENIILSEANEYENFFRTTTATIIDSDRIDIAVLNTGVEILSHAVPYNRDLLVCSETAQFRLTYQNFLGPKSVQVKFTTAFNMSKRIRPVNMGNSLYFIDDRADYNFMKVWEYFPKDLAVSDDAEEVTSPIPEYIPQNCSFMAASNRAKSLVLTSASSPSTLFVYKYFWAGDKKVQTAWGKWTFNDVTKLHWGGFTGTFLYMFVQRSNGLNLERIRFDEDVFDNSQNYEIMLDRRTTNVIKSYDPTNDKTYIVTPWTTTYPDVEIISSGEGVTGYRHEVTKLASNEFAVDGDITSHTITVGLPYTWLYEFSTQYFRQRQGDGSSVVLDGRVQLRYLTVEYHNSAYFKTHVVLPGRDEFVSTFNGRLAGSELSLLGSQAFSSGKYRIAVMGKNTEVRVWLTNDSPFPHAFGSAEWQGIISPKSTQRV